VSVIKSLEMQVRNCSLIELPTIQDGIDGTISIAEGSRQIPFKIKRVYYVYNLANQTAIRGKHAHKKLEQVMFCISGSFLMKLNDGQNEEELWVYKPNVGIYIGVDLWHTMTNFSSNCILLVLASDYYEESDYIRDYNEFLAYTSTKLL
jgi:dTDP-4-dehydrorhamnose 3,5-epimerase-like enzyme